MWVHHGGENPQKGIHRIEKIGQQRTALAQSSDIRPDVGSRSEITDPDKKNEINRDLTASIPSAGTPTWTRAARLKVMSMIFRIMMIIVKVMVVIVMMVMIVIVVMMMMMMLMSCCTAVR